MITLAILVVLLLVLLLILSADARHRLKALTPPSHLCECGRYVYESDEVCCYCLRLLAPKKRKT